MQKAVIGGKPISAYICFADKDKEHLGKSL